jgi:alginate O-acetyltransferase complex protein AlgI
MLFTSGEFLFIYLPVTLAGFFAIARGANPSWAAAWLTLASLVFYGYWHPPHTLLLILSIAFNYALGSLILKVNKNAPTLRRRLLILAVTVDLLVLAYFKYADFLINTVSNLGDLKLPSANVILPIGISFFTFTQIAYLVDVYAGKVREKSPLHYALFVTYFPHLIAGPVLHHSEMMPQFGQREIYSPRLRNFAVGLVFLTIGLAKKVLIADSAAPIANNLFESAKLSVVATPVALFGVLAYSLQIYFDFSGYSDMAVGLARLLGIKFPYNFNSPYKATSIIEFWRRWHMTLSRFLRDYLYIIALGGNRHGTFRRYLNLMITMLLGGLWHGASWMFVAWGALHGAFLVINHGWRFVSDRFAGQVGRVGAPVPQAAKMLLCRTLTLCSVFVAWIAFRADDAQVGENVFQSIVGHGSRMGQQVQGVSLEVGGWLTAGLLLALLGRNSQELIDGDLSRLIDSTTSRKAVLFAQSMLVGSALALIILLALISASRNVTEFIYFNF